LVLLYRYILTVIQRITQNISTLLAIVWFCAIVGCRDFKDYRTPYQSFVSVVLKPINEDDKLTVPTITNTATKERILLQSFKNDLFCNLPLDPNTDSVQFDIDNSSATSPKDISTSSATSPKKLTIYYQRKAVLISHQCGCAYEYTIKEVRVTSGIKLKILNEKLSALNDSDINIQISL
jgi:Family of unknown function (DUF6452)